MKARVTPIFSLFLVVVILAGIPGSVVLAAPSTRWGGGGSGGSSLIQTEINGLLYMREEEKLAHDAYVNLYAKWGLTTFSNISSAETNHMNAVGNLLSKYSLPDPAKGNGVGMFTNSILQSLYINLMARGNQSLVDAILVGGMVEEVDIADLEKYLSETNRTDIIYVYRNLKAGSCNHLRAFASQYTRRAGLQYQAQLLAQSQVQAILNGGC